MILEYSALEEVNAERTMRNLVGMFMFEACVAKGVECSRIRQYEVDLRSSSKVMIDE